MKKRKIAIRFIAIIICSLTIANSRITGSAQKTRTYKIIAAESNLWVYDAKGGLPSALVRITTSA